MLIARSQKTAKTNQKKSCPKLSLFLPAQGIGKDQKCQVTTDPHPSRFPGNDPGRGKLEHDLAVPLVKTKYQLTDPQKYRRERRQDKTAQTPQQPRTHNNGHQGNHPEIDQHGLAEIQNRM